MIQCGLRTPPPNPENFHRFGGHIAQSCSSCSSSVRGCALTVLHIKSYSNTPSNCDWLNSTSMPKAQTRLLEATLDIWHCWLALSDMQPQLISLPREFAISACLQTTCRAGCHCRTLPLPKSCSCRHIADVRQFPGIAESFQLWNSSALFTSAFCLYLQIDSTFDHQPIYSSMVRNHKTTSYRWTLHRLEVPAWNSQWLSWYPKEAGMGCIMCACNSCRQFFLAKHSSKVTLYSKVWVLIPAEMRILIRTELFGFPIRRFSDSKLTCRWQLRVGTGRTPNTLCTTLPHRFVEILWRCPEFLETPRWRWEIWIDLEVPSSWGALYWREDAMKRFVVNDAGAASC